MKTTEIIFPNGHVANGPVDLPETRAGHCLLENSGTVISIGGYDPTNHTSYTSTVWMFDANNNFSLTVGPSMKHTRNHHACGIFQSSAHSGRPLVVAAGGRGTEEITPCTSEFWDFTMPGSEWQVSKYLASSKALQKEKTPLRIQQNWILWPT